MCDICRGYKRSAAPRGTIFDNVTSVYLITHQSNGKNGYPILRGLPKGIVGIHVKCYNEDEKRLTVGYYEFFPLTPRVLFDNDAQTLNVNNLEWFILNNWLPPEFMKPWKSVHRYNYHAVDGQTSINVRGDIYGSRLPGLKVINIPDEESYKFHDSSDYYRDLRNNISPNVSFHLHKLMGKSATDEEIYL